MEYQMFKKTILFLASMTLITPALLAKPVKRSDQQIQQKVETLLSNMTIEEKVGQMTQITLGVILDDSSREKGDGLNINKEKLKKRFILIKWALF